MKVLQGVSQNWDPELAVDEAYKQINNQSTEPLKGILVFCTIHYKMNNGFLKILNYLNEKTGSATPLIGGTVAGFMNKSGVYTRGIAIVFFYGDNLDVGIGIGTGTKASPAIAGKSCAQMISKALGKSFNKNKVFFTMISSAIVPNLPILKNRKVIDTFPGIDIALGFFDRFAGYLKIGSGKDESVMQAFSNQIPEFSGIGGGSSDDLKLEENYQFFMNRIYTNSIVGIGVSTNETAVTNTTFGLKPTGKNLRIDKKSASNYIIQRINNDSALSGYLKVMGWDRSVLDERLYRKVFYFPIVQKDASEETIEPRMFGLVYGNSFVFPMKPNGDNLEIYQSSGSDLVNSSKSLIGSTRHQFGLIVSCATRLETLGDKTYYIKEQILDKNIEDYILIYTAGEYSKKPGTKMRCFYQSDNAILFN